METGNNNVVEFRADQTLKVIFPNNSGFPVGSSAELSFKQLMALMTKNSKSRKSTAGGKISRQISLASRAIATGKWSTGALSDPNLTATKLVAAFQNLNISDFEDITPAAINSLSLIVNSENVKAELRGQLGGFLGELRPDLEIGAA